MPKTYNAPSCRKAYVPRKRTAGSTTARPYGGSRYGNDAYVKVENIEPLVSEDTLGQVYANMRTTGSSTDYNGN